MAKHFVTLGQGHRHNVNGFYLDHDCVVCYNASSYKEGREKAFEYFGDAFFTDYHDDEINNLDLSYFPRGIINIEKMKEVEKTLMLSDVLELGKNLSDIDISKTYSVYSDCNAKRPITDIKEGHFNKESNTHVYILSYEGKASGQYPPRLIVTAWKE